MSFASPLGGPIASAFVEVTADTQKADQAIRAFLRSLTVDSVVAAERAGEAIEDAFAEAARRAQVSLRDVGGPGVFAPVTSQAEVAGEGIEDSFSEAQRQVDTILSSIGGFELFQAVQAQAEAAGEGIEESFAEAQRQADAQLRDIGGVGTFAPVTAQAEVAGESIQRSFSEASRQSNLSLAAIGRGALLLSGALAVAGGAVVGFGLSSAASLEQTDRKSVV